MPRHSKRKQEAIEDNGVERPGRELDRITEDEAYSAVEEMFPRGLNTIIDSVLKSQVRKSLPPSEDDFFEEMRTVATALKRSDVIIPRWHSYVTNDFEDLAHAAWLRLRALSIEEEQKKPKPTEDGRIRTCPTMINRVLRQDLLRDPPDISDLLKARLHDPVAKLTDIKTGPKQLDIENVLPEVQIRHKNLLVESKFIPVAPLPPTLKSASLQKRNPSYVVAVQVWGEGKAEKIGKTDSHQLKFHSSKDYERTKRLEAGDQAAERTNWQKKIRYTQERIAKHNLSKQGYHNNTASNINEIEEWFLSDEEDDDWFPSDKEDEELSLSDNEADADKDQDNDAVLAAEPAIPSEMEVSAFESTIYNLAKELLYQAVSIDTLPERLNEEKKRVSHISEDERTAFIRIFTLLRNYMPENDLRQSIVAKLPIVWISNFVQRCAGYHKFTRRIFPTIRPAKIHSFNVDAAAIYEMMASSVVEEHFNIVDRNNNPLTSFRFTISK
ncbi:unnamed protein product [Umbelopsis vinacea]